MVRQVTSESEFNKIISSPKLTLVDFYADWCGPCKAIAPRIDALEAQNPSIQFIKVNCDTNPDISGKYGIRAMPTFLFFKSGKLIETIVGANVGQVERVIKSNQTPSAGKGYTLSGKAESQKSELNSNTIVVVGLGLFLLYLYFNK